jgi:N-acetylglutamate synthase
MPIQIAPMTTDDYPEVMDLWRSLPGIGLSSADSPEAIARYLARNDGMSFIARSRWPLAPGESNEGGRVVGAVLCGHDGRRGYLHHLTVAPEYRHRGIGRRLAEACLAALTAAGMEKCHLFVFADNAAALAFWQRIGWADRVEIKLMSRNL